MSFFKIFILLILVTQSALAQKKLPIIKATTSSIKVKDDKSCYQSTLSSSNKEKSASFFTSNKNSKMTFYTDLDSISFFVKPDKKQSFVILLNNKDSIRVNVTYSRDHDWPGWLDALKKGNEYNLEETREMPKFLYQSENNPDLLKLRTGFKLDSIAGMGDQVTRILNLLYWVHDLIPHDGGHENPTIKNSLNLIATCKKDRRGLNCRGLATILNECYLAIGIKSRMVTCYPKDTSDFDCHVINAVYSTQLKKWLWIDPTNNAYVMDEKKELLSIEEVRQRLINGKTVLVNSEANWNHKLAVTNEEYLYNYMAKNLYRLECPVNSEFDLETRKQDKIINYVELIPLDYFDQVPDKTKKIYMNGTTIIKYKTNNSALFWRTPES